MSENKLAFSINQKIYQEEIEFQLAKLNNITICATSKKIKHFAILSIKNETAIGQKRSIRYDSVDTIYIRGVQDFDKYEKLSLIEIIIEGNKILRDLERYQNNCKYRFRVDGHLFSSRTLNEVHIMFITCNGLNDAHYSQINGKSFKTLGVINLDHIKNSSQR